MGGFFNIVFSILLGWMQGLAALIWNTFTLREGESFLTYLGKNWITIAAILCVTGLAADFAVYIFRWEAYHRDQRSSHQKGAGRTGQGRRQR